MAHDIRAFTTNGFTPFTTHGDAAAAHLCEAHALLIALGDAAVDRDSVLGELNSDLQVNVFRGIASLVAYAQFHLDADADEDRPGRHEGTA